MESGKRAYHVIILVDVSIGIADNLFPDIMSK